MKSLKARRIITNTLIYIILIAMALIWLFPVFWLILQSLSGDGAGSKANLFHSTWTFDNYTNLLFSKRFEGAGTYDGYFVRWFGQTLLIAVCSTVISTLFVLGTAYALSRFRFSIREGFMKLNLIMGMFPGFLGMIIIYWGIKAIDAALYDSLSNLIEIDEHLLENNYLLLIIIYSAGAGGGYYIAKGFFDTISKSIDEAAMIDGATKGQIFWKIILPLSKPIIVYTILTSFMAPWGEYITSSYLLGVDKMNWTVAVGLWSMANASSAIANQYYTQFAAGAVVVAIPITILFMCMQKYYVSGVSAGAVKG